MKGLNTFTLDDGPIKIADVAPEITLDGYTGPIVVFDIEEKVY